MQRKILLGAAILALIMLAGLVFFKFLKSQPFPKPSNQPPPAATQSGALQPDARGQIHPLEKVTVTLTSSGFDPKEVTVKKNGEVSWLNKSGKQASVNSDPHPTHQDFPPLNLGLFPSGSNVSLVFDKTGTFKYHNHLSPSQTGVVIVQ